jgi:hypothetical protein
LKIYLSVKTTSLVVKNFEQIFSIRRAIEGKINLKGRLKEKSISNQISINLAFSWSAITTHAKFEQYDRLRFIKIEMILSRLYRLTYFQSN